MILRFPPLPAVLLAGLALAPVAAFAQAGSNFADTTSQQVPAYSGTVIEDIIARVNDQVISKSDYERAQQQLEQEAQQQSWSQQELMEQRRDLLRSLIDKQLLLSRAKELDINGETDLVKRLDEIRKQNNLDSMEDLQKAVEAQGISYEDFKQQIRDNIITSQVISQEVGPHISVSESEIQNYYNAHRQEFMRPEEVHLNEILISTADPDNATQVSEAEKKADDVENRLKSGADFATLAKAESGGPTAQQGGDLGDFKTGQLPKVMEDATFSLQPGQYTAPIRTKQGWLILQVTQHQKGGQAPLKDVENQIQEQVGMSKMEPAMRGYLTKLREEAYITVRPGYVDSGASPNEIKFIQGAYVPPQPKKKKKVVRTRFNGRPGRGRKVNVSATSSAAPPAGVPTLDKVNSQAGSKTVASAGPGTQKPGKKEKIRFGQAPRETLPTGTTRSVDAGATQESAPQQQVAINQPGLAPADNAAPADTADTDAKKPKTRYSDRLKETKVKQTQRKEQAAANKHHKFVPPPETQTAEAQAKDKRQDAAYGLEGDTTKPKKVNPAKSGPKRRMSDQDKQQPAQNGTQTTAPASGTATPPAEPAPQPQSGTPTQPQAQGTQPQL